MFCRVFSWWMFQVQRINESCRARKMQKFFFKNILSIVGSSQGAAMYPMKVLMKYSRPNSCANPSLIARQERAGTEILLLGGVWNYSTILGSSSLGSRERGSIFAWYQVSPSKTLRDPRPPSQPGHLPPFTITALSLDAESPLCLWWMFHHFHLFWPQTLQHFHLFGPHTIFQEKYGITWMF